ncbi:Na+/H+ antiporter subunit D [Galactobacter sp.]|uniref:Na+/H+ antiporter subunit D n=1 Tax=Galactobacter sp. TaxID=2676125 RepID=UPI0025BEB104|nr:Na+/H+ antiporter subunit D [Galactobacter sp.]
MNLDLTFLAPLAVLLPLFAAAVTFVLRKHAIAQRIVSISTLSAVLVLESLMLAWAWVHGASAVFLGGWAPPFGITMVVDEFSALMLVVSSVVSLAVLVYATAQGSADGDEDGPVSVFFPAFMILIAGVSNAFLAGDLFNLYVGFEILLTSSYVLLTLGGSRERVRAGTTYVVVSIISSLLFLTSIAMIYGATGTVNMADLSGKLADLDLGTQTVLHLMLLTAFGIKAAVFPLSFWLPDSYPTAPAPVTAVFAGLLTKVGVYAMIRTETLLFPDDDVSILLMWVAAATMVVGILGAVAQTDIKRMLSFTLTSHIGFMVFGLATGTEVGLTAAIYYVAHHIVVQTSLFLVVGLIERRAATSNLDRLGSLLKVAPVLAVLYFIPAMNLAGIPPFSGFLGKLGLVQAGVQLDTPLSWTLVAASMITSLLTLLAVARVFNRGFWRPASQAERPDPLLLATAESGARVRTYEVVADTPESKYSHRGDTKVLPAVMVWTTGALVAVGIALTVFAGPLFDFAERSAHSLMNPSDYVETVMDSDDEIPEHHGGNVPDAHDGDEGGH